MLNGLKLINVLWLSKRIPLFVGKRHWCILGSRIIVLDWVASKQQKHLVHSSGIWKPEVRVPERSGESPLLFWVEDSS